MLRLNESEDAVSNMIEYLFISGILMLLMIITTLALTSVIIERPVDQLSEYAFIDIGNGISTRVVDLYVIAPYDTFYTDDTSLSGNVTTKFDIPDDVVGREYFVNVQSGLTGDQIVVYRGDIQRKVSLAGIGTTLGVAGSTTGHGLNIIEYESAGFP
jgi:hypothetical protein